MEKQFASIIEEWPTVSFDEYENIEIENLPARLMYQSLFFFMFKLPEATLKAFYKVITENPDSK